MSRPVHLEILGENPETRVAFHRETSGREVATWDGPQAYRPAEA